MAENAADEKRVALVPRAAMLLESMRDIGYTFESAVADLVDNSLSAGATNIWVDARWNSGDKFVAIADDGCAMNRAALLEAMRLGSADPTAARAETLDGSQAKALTQILNAVDATFPGAAQTARANRLVSYVLNPVAARHCVFGADDEEGDEE